ncbi:MAG: family 78 glycoside hydrolase catalytic domain [Candidatus Brocadiia bacterium]
MKVTFDENARWIWNDRSKRPANNFACFRRCFTVKDVVEEAQILITADARYEMYLNGSWIGHGPIRSWPSSWRVDRYDLTGFLQPGDNVLAAIVQDIGVGTFQYINSEPGLLAQVDIKTAQNGQRIVTNRAWQSRAHPGYGWPVPRISCQQAWEEQYDARKVSPNDSDWRSLSFDDSGWERSRVLRRPGQPPHETLVLRDIPHLTREPVKPQRLVSAEMVRAAPFTWSLNPRRLLNSQDLSASMFRGKMLLVTHIYSQEAQDLRLQSPHGDADWKLNGEILDFQEHGKETSSAGTTTVRLENGWNVLMHRMPEKTHFYRTSINLWTEKAVRFAAIPSAENSDIPWLALGPFEGISETKHPLGKFITAEEIPEGATEEKYEALWESGRPDPDDLIAEFARPMPEDSWTTTDVFAICASEETVENSPVELENPEAMLQDTPEWTVVFPPEDGCSVRLLLDFGDELVGYHELEIDAPKNTIIDDHNFEFIQRDGRKNLAEGMNNTFRYVCREGIQHYKTFVRRGFRYSWLTLRNFNKPVRIRYVRAIFNTYPQKSDGAFECSDRMLSRIWEVGARTLRCCSEDTYTDCPTYEQTHWVGDARNEALVDLLVNGDPQLSRHCWLQAARSLDRSELVECHVPSAWASILSTWSLLWMRWAQEHYLLTDDEPLAKDMLRYLERNICGLEQYINDDDLLDIEAWNMLDWAPMDAPNEGIVTHLNCLAVLALRQCADLAFRTTQKGRAQRWEESADRLKNAINEHLWDEDRRAYIDSIHSDGVHSETFSQQTQTMAYLAEVAEADRAERALSLAIEPPEDFVTAGSPFFMFFLLETMVKAGKYDDLVQTIRNYWGLQINAGATTFWENYHAEQERLTRSHCHAWSAAPSYFLPREVLGVKPLEPGYARVVIAPHVGNLTWAHGRVPTPRGCIECLWQAENGIFHLDVGLPESVPTLLELPFTGELQVKTGSAEPVESPERETHLECPGGKLILEIQIP